MARYYRNGGVSSPLGVPLVFTADWDESASFFPSDSFLFLLWGCDYWMI